MAIVTPKISGRSPSKLDANIIFRSKLTPELVPQSRGRIDGNREAAVPDGRTLRRPAVLPSSAALSAATPTDSAVPVRWLTTSPATPAGAEPVRSLYVHVPFCAHKCEYCAFYSAPPSGDVVNRYVAALVRELELIAPDCRPNTIFFGGGTPSLLRGAEIAVAPGDRLCLVGRNGSGKSTLL